MSGGTSAVNSGLLSSGQPRLGQQPPPGATAAFPWERVSTLEYAPLAEAVPSARRHARHVLREWGFGAIALDAEVVLSELLTNAIRESAALPSRPPVRFKLMADPSQLMIEVFDTAPGKPVRRARGLDEAGGRGLGTVEALGHRWDWTRHEDGKN